MAIDKLLGRTVAFNQLIDNGNFADGTTGWSASGATISASDGILSSVATEQNGRFYQSSREFINGHVYILLAQFKASASTTLSVYNSASLYFNLASVGTSFAQYGSIRKNDKTTGTPSIIFQDGAASDWKTVQTKNVMLIDLTAMYGTTLADSIYAMEQATTGAGVAYVRQRMDSDYYAANSGTLTAPVVSGVSFVGFNLWDEEWEISDSKLFSKNYIPVTQGAQYYLKIPQYASQAFLYVYCYDENHSAVTNIGVVYYNDSLITIPNGVFFIKFRTDTAYGTTYHNDICINVSKTTGTPKNGDYLPYQHASLSIPSTRLDGVGDAQDVMYVREDGENDYSIVKTAKMARYNLGSFNWSTPAVGGTSTAAWVYCGDLIGLAKSVNNTTVANIICPKYTANTANAVYGGADGCIAISSAQTVSIYSTAFVGMTAAQVKAALADVYIAVELATPTETVIAEHLTLAEVSAIAENGGIISIVNSNGHIVQPDFVADVVISRSSQ